MHFIHEPYQPGRTIAAVATAPGEGAVSIIRISGKNAIDIASKVCQKNLTNAMSHKAFFSTFKDIGGQTVDSGLVIVMKSPKSYTGEDTVELQGHGGSFVTRKLIQAVLAHGAIAAKPGEFTFRAFMNGKLDLLQAEAVAQLIGAKNEMALNAAELQLEGFLSSKVKSFQQQLIDISAIIEAWVDFPEEGLEFASFESIIESLQQVHKDIEQLASTFHHGQLVFEGFKLCLMGRPNVGKSSLMNALLRKDKAIVTEIAGTTRDVLEETMSVGGVHLKLMDTAGIRQTDERIEQEGIKRSWKASQEADIVLFLVDAEIGFSQDDQQLFEQIRKDNLILVWNKIDQLHGQPLPNFNHSHVVGISAKNHQHIDLLEQEIQKLLWKGDVPSKEEIMLTSLRHLDALNNAKVCLESVINGLKIGVSAEFVASDMRQSIKELGKIIGLDVTEDVLGAIFSKFCLGK